MLRCYFRGFPFATLQVSASGKQNWMCGRNKRLLKSGLCRVVGWIHLTFANDLTDSWTPSLILLTIKKEKEGLMELLVQKHFYLILMCNLIFSISPGKCGRLSNRCVLWALNNKIIKRHLTIRGLHINIALHRLSRTLYNAVALMNSTQRCLCKQVKNVNLFSLCKDRVSYLHGGYGFVNK